MAAPNKYANGKIYVVTCGEHKYVGSTVKTLEQRKERHIISSRDNLDRLVYQHCVAMGWDNVTFDLIHAFPCNSKLELRMEEQRVIDLLSPDLNTIKAYQNNEDAKDKAKQRKKVWREKHKVAELERSKQWAKDNPEKRRAIVRAWGTKVVTCPACNTQLSQGALKRHTKTKHPNV